MKKICIAGLTAIALAFGAFPASAPAAVQVGNGCWVHAYEPVPLNARIGFEGYPQGKGRIDGCANADANYNMRLQACIQVQAPDGSWATKSETCLDSGTVSARALEAYPTAYNFASPRTYRTWSWGCSGGICKVMTSAGARW